MMNDLGNLVQRLEPRLHRYFALRGFAPEDSEDLTQETLFRILTGVGRLREPAAFEGWIFKVASNVRNEFIRRRCAAKRDAEVVALDEARDAVACGALGADAATITRGSPSPLEQAVAHQRVRLLAEAIEKLPPKAKRVLVLRVYHDRSYREIATMLKISINTVKAHLAQSRARLGTALDKEAGRHHP